MYILFADESGTAPPSLERAKGQKYFVIGGLTIPDGEWRNVAAKLLGLKTRFKLHGELKWRFFAPGNEDDANPMRGMPFPERDKIRTEMLAIITSVKSIRIMAAVASLEVCFAMPGVQGAEDLYAHTYKPVSERFQYYLQDLRKQSGAEQFGIVVCDHRGPADDKALRAHHQRLVARPGIYTSRYPNFIETVFFAPSHLSVGLQLADMVAGSIWRKFERSDERYYKLIEPAVRRGPAGDADGYGIVKVPKAGWK